MAGAFLGLFTALTPAAGAEPAAATSSAPSVAQTTPPAANATYKPEYRLSVAVGTTYAWGKGADTWARLVKERTSGRINIRVYPGYSAVGGDAQREVAALREGAVDLAIGSALVWSTSVKSLGLFALPFFFADERALDAVLSGETGRTLLERVTASGVVALAFGDNAFHELSSADRPLRRPEDFRGLRLRTSADPIVDDVLSALGAQPSRMSWNEAQQALRSGALQGQETTLPAFVATKAQTLGQGHVTRIGIAADPLVFAVSPAAWQGWSESDRAIVRQAALDAAAEETVAARAAVAAAEKSILGLRGAGVVLERPSAAEHEALRAALAPVTERWSREVGVEIVEGARRAMAATSPR